LPVCGQRAGATTSAGGKLAEVLIFLLNRIYIDLYRNGEVVAYDSIERLRELMSQPSLEGVFAQLAQVDDGDDLANRRMAMSISRCGITAFCGSGSPGAIRNGGIRLLRSR
jgi:hypothetical protein